MGKSLMQMFLDAGIPREELYTNEHNSDLYVYINSLTTHIVNEWCRINGFRREYHCPIFKSAIDGKPMYECIFANDEYWKNVAKLSEEISDE